VMLTEEPLRWITLLCPADAGVRPESCVLILGRRVGPFCRSAGERLGVVLFVTTDSGEVSVA
jgi:hypothetical protein